MRHAWTLLLLVATGCSSGSGTPLRDGGSLDPATGPALADAGATDGGPALADAGVADGADASTSLTYRNSLGVCWTDPSCNRALAVSHGGDWSAAGNPYDSNAAITAAFANGADGVKLDVRFTSDNVPVIAHSSPIELYESLDCYNRKIEEMTAAEVTTCHRFPSQTETFQRLDAVLNYLRGKLVVQLCVKRAEETAQSVAAVIALGAEDFTFLEISTSDLQTKIPTITGSEKVYYLINVKQLDEVDTLLDTIKNPRAFMFEFEPDLAVSTLVTTRLHPAGIRSFTYDKQASSTPSIKARFDAGFDVVSTNANANAVQARVQVNTARGISPP